MEPGERVARCTPHEIIQTQETHKKLPHPIPQIHTTQRRDTTPKNGSHLNPTLSNIPLDPTLEDVEDDDEGDWKFLYNFHVFHANFIFQSMLLQLPEIDGKKNTEPKATRQQNYSKDL